MRRVDVLHAFVEFDLRLGLFWHQASLQLPREIANFVLPSCTGGWIVRVTQPQAQLHQRQRQLTAQAHAERQGKRQQDQAQQPHALQANGHRLLELLHVEVDTQVAGNHVLEADGGRVEAFLVA